MVIQSLKFREENPDLASPISSVTGHLMPDSRPVAGGNVGGHTQVSDNKLTLKNVQTLPVSQPVLVDNVGVHTKVSSSGNS
jgi:hypothetical protein